MQALKLGTQTGSFINHIMSSGNELPEVGKGATEFLWSDRHAYFVDSVSEDKKKCVISRPICKRTDGFGMSESQTYEYVVDPGAKPINMVFRYGSWYREYKAVEYTKEFLAILENRRLTEQEREGLFDDNAELKVVEGKTYLKKGYAKMNIRFGGMMEYYDFSF